jgi:hypothetical protein
MTARNVWHPSTPINNHSLEEDWLFTTMWEGNWKVVSALHQRNDVAQPNAQRPNQVESHQPPTVARQST